MTNKIYVAYLQTPSYEFQAFGITEAETMQLMKKAWKKHMKETGATGGWQMFKDDVCVYEIEVGKCYRDKEEIV